MPHSKKIYDSVHGFIYFSELEKELIDSSVFQRLHYLRQLGVAYLVYPGASHSRFQHSLGVMHIATQIFEQIMKHYLDPIEERFVDYWRQIIRFAALCHDLGHLPFSHTAEEILLSEKGGHETWTLALIESPLLSSIWEKVRAQFPGKSVVEDIAKISLGEEKLSQVRGKEEHFSLWEHVLSQVITGDFFGADRIDYLLRDARCTGVSYGLFDYQQLIASLRVLPVEGTSKGRNLALGIEENGVESCEALLLARHFMHRRVYQYPTVKAYGFHMARFIKQLYQKENLLQSLEKYLSYTDNEVLCKLREALYDPKSSGHLDAAALLAKKNRYLAYEIEGMLDEMKAKEWSCRCQLEPEEIFVVPAEIKKEKPSFSFPVLLSNGTVADARRCFSVAIRSHVLSWIFVSPGLKDRVKELTDAALFVTQGEGV